jgi:hypothetical protein
METEMNKSSYLVYICQAVKNRAGLERYWQVARYPENINVLAGYGPFEVLDADQDERVEGVVLAEFLPFEQTVECCHQLRAASLEGNSYTVTPFTGPCLSKIRNRLCSITTRAG